MEQKNKIAVIGGTGKSGKFIVNELLRQGFKIKILLRNPEKFYVSSSLIEVVKGDARDYASLHSLLKGTKAVISSLGQPKGERSIFSDASRNVLRAMKEFGISRYILISGLNVDTPFDRKSPKTKFATDWMKTNYPETTMDKQAEYELLTESEAYWTLVRIPLIEQTNERKKVTASLEDCEGDKISVSDLACFLIDQLSDENYIRKAPFISNV